MTPRDPQSAARAGMRPALPKRFYKAAGVEEGDGAFHLALDGRRALTPRRKCLALPTRGLAEAVAAEWDRQGPEIVPSTMPVTRIVNVAIDGVSARASEVVDDIVKYAGSDLTCYRAAGPARLVEEQKASWDPVIRWAREALGASLAVVEGVAPVVQPDPALGAVRRRVERVHAPFALAALHVMTTLTGSALISLAHADGLLDVDGAWNAAHADELFQESLWGKDEEALVRRRNREAEFAAASLVYRLSGEE